MDALAMGNYGSYVWSCFVLALIVIVVSEWASRLRHRRVYRDIEVQIKALEERR
jgi:heme exporter protein CcmD